MERLWRYRVPVTAIALSVFSVLLVSISAHAPGRIDPIGQLLLDGLAPLQAGVTWLRHRASDAWEAYFLLVDTRRENETLRARVDELEQRVVELSEVERTNRRLQELLQLRSQLGATAYGARVIGRDPLRWSHTLTVDRGRRDGIRKGMAAISPRGVVGQVIEVGHLAARVMLLTDRHSGIDAIVQRSRARGIVQGALEEGCVMKYIARGDDIAVGDRIVTSGLDGIYPKGVMVGEVTVLSRRDLLQVAAVRPSAPIERIEEVLLVDAGASPEEGPQPGEPIEEEQPTATPSEASPTVMPVEKPR